MNQANCAGPQVVELNRLHLSGLLEKQQGKFVGIDYVKLDKSNRSLNGRLGVTSPLRGGENKTATPDRPYLTMYDVQAKGYRTVNLSTVQVVRAGNSEYHVVD